MEVTRHVAPWDRFLRAYCLFLILIAIGCLILSTAAPVPIPWPRSALGRIVLAFIVGYAGVVALGHMMARVGGRQVLEGFLDRASTDKNEMAKAQELLSKLGAKKEAAAMAAEADTFTAPPSEVPGWPPGTVTLGLTLSERFKTAAEGSAPLLPPTTMDAVYGVLLGVLGAFLAAVAVSTLARNIYLLAAR